MKIRADSVSAPFSFKIKNLNIIKEMDHVRKFKNKRYADFRQRKN
jgi:hypothetical protein